MLVCMWAHAFMLSCVCMCSYMCMHVLYLQESEESSGSLGTGVINYSAWLLENKPQSSARAARPLNHWAIYLLPDLVLTSYCRRQRPARLHSKVPVFSFNHSQRLLHMKPSAMRPLLETVPHCPDFSPLQLWASWTQLFCYSKKKKMLIHILNNNHS